MLLCLHVCKHQVSAAARAPEAQLMLTVSTDLTCMAPLLMAASSSCSLRAESCCPSLLFAALRSCMPSARVRSLLCTLQRSKVMRLPTVGCGKHHALGKHTSAVVRAASKESKRSRRHLCTEPRRSFSAVSSHTTLCSKLRLLSAASSAAVCLLMSFCSRASRGRSAITSCDEHAVQII